MTTHTFQGASAAQARLRLIGHATETVKQLDAASAELIQMQKMNAVGQLASGITHDFGNVLQAIMSGIDLIEVRAHDPDQVRRLAASLMRVTERGVELTQRLLAFARRQDVKPEAVNLPALLESVAELLLRTLGSKVHVEVETPPSGLWQPFIDPGQLELALLNLGINARDAMSGQGTLRLCARNVGLPEFERRHAANASADKLQGKGRQGEERRGPPLVLDCGDYVLLTVSDTGSGMDGETLERATEPFFTTKPAGKGSGLGLPMVYGFVTQHGGALRLRSQLGKGTSVELWLPCAAVRQQASSDDHGTLPSRPLWRAISGQVEQKKPI
jgi:signal transduction histidine kinase